MSQPVPSDLSLSSMDLLSDDMENIIDAQLDALITKPEGPSCPKCNIGSFMLAPSAFDPLGIWRCMTCGTLVPTKEK